MYAPMSTRHQSVLGTEQRDAATHPLQRVAARNLPALEDLGVELPRVTAGYRAQRLARDVVDHVRQRRGLIGHGAEVRERLLQRRVGAQRPERDTDARGFHFRVGPGHHRVEQDQPGDVVAVFGRERDADPSAHAVRDDDRRCGQAGVLGDRDDFARPRVHVVVVAPAALAVAGEIERHDAVLACEQRRDVIPPAGVRGTAVDQHQAGPVGGTPTPVVDRHAVDLDLAVLGRGRERVEEPLRRGRDSRFGQRSAPSPLPIFSIVSTYSSMMSNTTSFAGRTRSTRPMIWPTGEPESAFERARMKRCAAGA